MAYGTRQYYETRYAALTTERDSSWLSHWRDISDFMMPRLSRFLVTDRNRGHKKNQNILNEKATFALRVSSAGMVEGLTSRARPWFQLRAPDPGLNDFRPVKVWLELVANRMREVLLKSNFYTVVPLTRLDQLAYGTTACAVLGDYEDLIRCYHFPIGSYCLATSERGIAEVCYREFSMTVRQLIAQFGIQNCSPHVRALADQKTGAGLEQWITVLHAIEPNPDYNPRRQQFSQYKRFHSCYLEVGEGGEQKLRTAGFDRFRILAPRWMVTGEDVYGSSPGMDILPAVRGLQHREKRNATLVDKGVNPPLTAPADFKSGRVTQLPGDVTFGDNTAAGQGVMPLLDLSKFQYQWLMNDITRHEQRVWTGLYADLFLMFAGDTRATPPTAREVAERHEEKLWMLGPVVERDNDEHLDPLIDILFEEMLANGALPDAPKELQGHMLGVEYISILAQAMKLAGVSSVERGAAFIGGLVQMKPEAADMIDTYETVSGYWDMVGAPPKMIVDKKMFSAIQQRKMEQKQAAEMGAMAQPAAEIAKTMSETDTSGDNALTRVANQLQGAA